MKGRRVADDRGMSTYYWLVQVVDHLEDDFRTILQQAWGHVKTLLSLSRVATSPSASPGASTPPQALSLHDPETTRARIEAMTKLIGLLQRNLRVQYKLD